MVARQAAWHKIIMVKKILWILRQCHIFFFRYRRYRHQCQLPFGFKQKSGLGDALGGWTQEVPKLIYISLDIFSYVGKDHDSGPVAGVGEIPQVGLIAAISGHAIICHAAAQEPGKDIAPGMFMIDPLGLGK